MDKTSTDTKSGAELKPAVVAVPPAVGAFRAKAGDPSPLTATPKNALQASPADSHPALKLDPRQGAGDHKDVVDAIPTPMKDAAAR